MSQLAFLDLVERGDAFRLEAPTLWDVDFQTSLAQADLEDREMSGAYHRIKFSDIEIETTRPELIPACVALVAHPDDERFKARFGTTVRSPLFNVEVPVLAHELAQPDKGSGIAMICTFGDQTDVTWWRELDLPVRSIIGRNGRLAADRVGRPRGASPLRRVAGRNTKQAQKLIVEMLRESGDLVGDPRQISHAVKFWENGKSPLEIVTTRQWFIKFPPKEALLKRASELQLPSRVHARALAELDRRPAGRLEHHAAALLRRAVPDLVSGRRRRRSRLAVADHARRRRAAGRPVDRRAAGLHRGPAQPARRLHRRPRRDGHVGHVVDEPRVRVGLAARRRLVQSRVYPMDLRPQAQDIIRTWLFYSIVRGEMQFDTLPWTNPNISGFVTDPDRKKLSKSAATPTTARSA